MLEKQGEVLRFSGRTAEGSKGIIKLWSRESVERVVSMLTASPMGLLSHKVRRFTELTDPENAPRLHIYQPVLANEGLHILYDCNFLQGTISRTPITSDSTILRTFSPSISCDLFLTSLCLFEREPGFTATVKASIFRKWQLLSRVSKQLNIIPFLYCSDAISFAYRT